MDIIVHWIDGALFSENWKKAVAVDPTFDLGSVLPSSDMAAGYFYWYLPPICYLYYSNY